MSSFYDPTPIIERAVPPMRGSALAGGLGGETIPVKWQGKTVDAMVVGIPLAELNIVSIVKIDNRVFALANSGGYPSTEKHMLSSWGPKARYSQAIRQLMKKNPKRKKYELVLVTAWNPASSTATLATGETVLVRFGAREWVYDGSATVGSVALLHNGSPRHVIGGALTFGDIFSFSGMGSDLIEVATPMMLYSVGGEAYYDADLGFPGYGPIPVRIRNTANGAIPMQGVSAPVGNNNFTGGAGTLFAPSFAFLPAGSYVFEASMYYSPPFSFLSGWSPVDHWDIDGRYVL